jgi:syntaxin-binding protein 1
MDFQVIDRNIFSLNQYSALEHLWGTKGDKDGMIRAIARQLMNLCVTMHEFPFIRFKAGYPCEEIATAFKIEIENYQRTHDKWLFNPERATIFIIDRTNDIISPFLHEFTYQAMIYDLLPVKNDTCTYTTETGKGKVEKIAALNDSDSMWMRYKHTFITETQKELQQELKVFMDEHAAFQLLQNGQQDQLDLETLNRTVAGLSEYQASVAVFSRHINIAKNCMSMFTGEKLQAVALIEQTLATGYDQDKRIVKVSELYKNLQMRFADESMSVTSKVRMLALFLITQDGIKEDWRRKLVEIGKIPSEWESALGNLRLLGINTLVEKPNPKRTSLVPTQKVMKGSDESVLARFTPLLKDMIMGEAERTLNTDDYPYIVEPPPKEIKKTPAKGGGSSFASGLSGNI